MKRNFILLILIICLLVSSCQDKDIKLSKDVGNLSIDTFKLSEYLDDYKEFLVLEYKEIVDNQNNRVYLQTTLSDNRTKKQMDVWLSDKNKLLNINSVTKQTINLTTNSISLKLLIKNLDGCYNFKANILKNKNIVIEILTSRVKMDFVNSKNVYRIEPDGTFSEYREKTFDGYIARIVSGGEMFHLCLTDR